MTDAPPPSGPPPVNPPPGWYPDPQTGGRGFRYWDGATWTDAWTDRPEDLRQGLTPAGEWIGQVLRTSASRAGHLFPLIVLLIVPITLLTSFAAWAAFRHGELTLPADDVEAMSFTNPEVNAGLYALVAIGMVVLLVANVALLLAAARQITAALDEEPEVWSTSMHGALPRLPRALGLTLVLLGFLFALYLVMAIGAVAAPVALLILFPLWLAGSVIIVLRFSLTLILAALAPLGTRCLRRSWELTRGRSWALVGRMALLTLFSVSISLLMQMVATPFVAIAGGTGTTPVEPGASEILLMDVLGANPAVFAIGQLFSAIGNGAAMILWTVGFVLINRDLADLVPPDPADPAPSPDPTHEPGGGGPGSDLEGAP